MQQQDRTRPDPKREPEQQQPILRDRIPVEDELEKIREGAREREEAWQATASLDEVLESDIDKLLSEDPTEFVIRFIQTVGQ